MRVMTRVASTPSDGEACKLLNPYWQEIGTSLQTFTVLGVTPDCDG